MGVQQAKLAKAQPNDSKPPPAKPVIRDTDLFFPFNNPSIAELIEKYGFTTEWIFEFKEIFEHLDFDSNGYIDRDDFIQLAQDKRRSVLTIYLDFLFSLGVRRKGTRMNFGEFVNCLLNFGLLNYEGLQAFVFRLIDTDNDEVVNLKDVYNFVCRKVDGKLVFPINVIRCVEFIDVEDELDIVRFKSSEDKFDFVLFPALLLQKKIQKTVIGAGFWSKWAD